MSSERRATSEKIAPLMLALREMSDQDGLFNQTVAERLGLNVTDFKCLSIISRLRPVDRGQARGDHRADHRGDHRGARPAREGAVHSPRAGSGRSPPGANRAERRAPRGLRGDLPAVREADDRALRGLRREAARDGALVPPGDARDARGADAAAAGDAARARGGPRGRALGAARRDRARAAALRRRRRPAPGRGRPADARPLPGEVRRAPGAGEARRGHGHHLLRARRLALRLAPGERDGDAERHHPLAPRDPRRDVEVRRRFSRTSRCRGSRSPAARAR